MYKICVLIEQQLLYYVLPTFYELCYEIYYKYDNLITIIYFLSIYNTRFKICELKETFRSKIKHFFFFFFFYLETMALV